MSPDFESYVRGALDGLTNAVQNVSDNVGDIHARVIVHDTKWRDLESRVGVLETKKSDPPRGAPPPSKLGEWYSEKSKVFRVPEEEMNQLFAEMQRREAAGKWDGAVRFLGRVGAPVLATLLVTLLVWFIAKR